jgi:2-dehydropantoate 2-reductase
MRIAVMGAGGVGGYFGARLAAAGHDVAFVARGVHLAALRRDGLHVRSANGDVELPKVVAVEDPRELPPVDFVLFAVKLRDVDTAAEAIRPLVADGGVAITVQNGVESVDRVAAVLGRERVMGAAAYLAATIAEPGVIVHTGTLARLRFGVTEPSQQAAAEVFLAACRAAGIDAVLEGDIRRVLWEKFVFLAAASGITAISGQPIGGVRSDPELRSMLEAAMTETWAVGRERGVALADDLVAQQMRFVDSLPADMRTSLLNDLVAGRPLEVAWLSGAVYRMARESLIAAPVNGTIFVTLEPYCEGRNTTPGVPS